MSENKPVHVPDYNEEFMTVLRHTATDLIVGYTIVREYRFAHPRHCSYDFAWVNERVAVEVVEADREQWVTSGGGHNRDSDREKLNYAASNGWRVMHVTLDMLDKDPVGFFNLLRLALCWPNEPF